MNFQAKSYCFSCSTVNCNDAGFDPGRVPPVVPDFQGELKCVEVDSGGAPVGGNHLKGEASLVQIDLGVAARELQVATREGAQERMDQAIAARLGIDRVPDRRGP